MCVDVPGGYHGGRQLKPEQASSSAEQTRYWHYAAAIIYFSQTFPAMLLRLVGTADTAGVCEKEP